MNTLKFKKKLLTKFERIHFNLSPKSVLLSMHSPYVIEIIYVEQSLINWTCLPLADDDIIIKDPASGLNENKTEQKQHG